MKPCVLLCLLLWKDKSEGVVPASKRFPSDLREEVHQGEIIGKRRLRIKVIGRVDFLEHLRHSERVFPADLLSAPCQMAISRRQIWRRDLTKQVTVNLQNSSGRSHAWRIANRKGGPGHPCKTSSRSSGDRCCLQSSTRAKYFQVRDASAEWAVIFFQAKLCKLGCRSWKSSLYSLGKQRTLKHFLSKHHCIFAVQQHRW